MTSLRPENETARAPTRTAHRKRCTATALTTATCLLAPGCTPDHAPAGTTTATNTLPVPPPAVSSIDNTVTVKIALADTFDVLPDGTCAGRSENTGIRDGAQVQLRGGSTWATTTHFEELPPRIYHGKPLFDDDSQYCIVKAVFAPTRHDLTSSYSFKFEGGDWVHDLVHVGRAPPTDNSTDPDTGQPTPGSSGAQAHSTRQPRTANPAAAAAAVSPPAIRSAATDTPPPPRPHHRESCRPGQPSTYVVDPHPAYGRGELAS